MNIIDLFYLLPYILIPFSVFMIVLLYFVWIEKKEKAKQLEEKIKQLEETLKQLENPDS